MSVNWQIKAQLLRIHEGSEAAYEEISEFDLSDAAANATNEVDNAIDSIGIDAIDGEAVNNAVEDGIGVVDDAIEDVPQIVEDGGKAVGNLVHGVLTVFGTFLGNAMEAVNNAMDSVDSAVEETEDVVADARRKRFAGFNWSNLLHLINLSFPTPEQFGPNSIHVKYYFLFKLYVR